MLKILQTWRPDDKTARNIWIFLKFDPYRAVYTYCVHTSIGKLRPSTVIFKIRLQMQTEAFKITF
jgi:hypothetical protein